MFVVGQVNNSNEAYELELIVKVSVVAKRFSDLGKIALYESREIKP